MRFLGRTLEEHRTHPFDWRTAVLASSLTLAAILVGLAVAGAVSLLASVWNPLGVIAGAIVPGALFCLLSRANVERRVRGGHIDRRRLAWWGFGTERAWLQWHMRKAERFPWADLAAAALLAPLAAIILNSWWLGGAFALVGASCAWFYARCVADGVRRAGGLPPPKTE